jgi:hypothetical protein
MDFMDFMDLKDLNGMEAGRMLPETKLLLSGPLG